MQTMNWEAMIADYVAALPLIWVIALACGVATVLIPRLDKLVDVRIPKFHPLFLLSKLMALTTLLCGVFISLLMLVVLSLHPMNWLKSALLMSTWVGLLLSALIVLLIVFLFAKIYRKENLFAIGLKKIELWWLRLLSEHERDIYQWHVKWRITLFGLKLRRYWARLKLWRTLMQIRWLWVLTAFGLTVLGLYEWFKGLGDENKALFALNILAEKPNFPALVGALLPLISLPILFFIWLFRDQNNRWQIENNRKDINLKDFQKLTEWAAGLHLPEDTVDTGGSDKSTNEASNVTTEKYNETKRTRSAPPENSALSTLSHWDGAVSLQIAAIFQLEAFLRGDFGAQFQRPAFQLLKSIWLAVKTPYVQDLANVMKESRTKYRALFAGVRSSDAYEQGISFRDDLTYCRVRHTYAANQALVDALTKVLLTDHGVMLRRHMDDLPGTMLATIETSTAFSNDHLELYECHLHGIQLQGARLCGANLQGADLSSAQLQGADLDLAQLQDANLFLANLQGADLSSAQLQGAKLDSAQLQGTDLSNTQLQGANLMRAQLQGASLMRAQLQGANLLSTQFQGAALDLARLQGVDLSNAWLQGASIVLAQLQGADLSWAQLQGADLTDANLTNANLTNADLTNANLTDTDLTGAILTGAKGLPPSIHTTK